MLPCDSSLKDAHLLIALLHREAMLISADVSGHRHQGLAVAAKSMSLPSKWRRRCREWDAALGLAEKISYASVKDYLEQFRQIATQSCKRAGPEKMTELYSEKLPEKPTEKPAEKPTKIAQYFDLEGKATDDKVQYSDEDGTASIQGNNDKRKKEQMADEETHDETKGEIKMNEDEDDAEKKSTLERADDIAFESLVASVVDAGITGASVDQHREAIVDMYWRSMCSCIGEVLPEDAFKQLFPPDHDRTEGFLEALRARLSSEPAKLSFSLMPHTASSSWQMAPISARGMVQPKRKKQRKKG